MRPSPPSLLPSSRLVGLIDGFQPGRGGARPRTRKSANAAAVRCIAGFSAPRCPLPNARADLLEDAPDVGHCLFVRLVPEAATSAIARLESATPTFSIESLRCVRTPELSDTNSKSD